MNTSSATVHDTLSAQIKRNLHRYLQGLLSIDAFHAWFSEIGWEVEQADDVGAEELVYDITLIFAEYSAGQLTETDLANSLRRLTQDSAETSLTLTSAGASVEWELLVPVRNMEHSSS